MSALSAVASRRNTKSRRPRENVFLDKLRSLLTSGEFPKQDRLVERLTEEGFTANDIVSALIHQLQSGEGAGKSAPRPRNTTARHSARNVRSPRRGRACEDRGPRDRYRETVVHNAMTAGRVSTTAATNVRAGLKTGRRAPIPNSPRR